jgi:hypothetical protein
MSEDQTGLEKISFEIVQVNLRRLQRGAEAVQINMYDDGELVCCLWMSKADIVKNIKEWGQHAALLTGLKIYKTRKDVREQSTGEVKK